MKLNTIEEALKDLAAGKMIIVVDDENRENEGDLVIAAHSVTPEIINTMVKSNSAHYGVNFSISIDAAQGITTGASVADKTITIKTLVNSNVSPTDFVSPGHIFPLIAKKGGVLTRPGHTEAAVDLATLAGLPPVAVISEITNEDGSMARLPQFFDVAEKMNLKIISIKDLITYRHRKEQIFFETTRVALPTNYGKFTLHVFENNIDQQVGFALTVGTFSDKPTLVRVHSECFTGDIFGSLRCDCGEQLETAMELLQKEKFGILIYLKQEGRGIGLINKIKAYRMQEQGLDTIEANHKLGFSSDLRNYALAAHILRYLNVNTINLLTNNPHKMSDLELYGVRVAQRIPLEGKAHSNNENYLSTKKNKMGHWLSNV